MKFKKDRFRIGEFIAPRVFFQARFDYSRFQFFGETPLKFFM